ncbi:hypothetical protein [Orenia metallireducens]|jgi:hypothetical protein|nr:hypothetical protein [Orenia metallireducens]
MREVADIDNCGINVLGIIKVAKELGFLLNILKLILDNMIIAI